MNNHELLMRMRKLEKARQDLLKFFSMNKNFYNALISMLDRYKDGYLEQKNFQSNLAPCLG